MLTAWQESLAKENLNAQIKWLWIAFLSVFLTACDNTSPDTLSLEDHPRLSDVENATDMRNPTAPVFDTLLMSGDYAVLLYLGQIGGREACGKIPAYLTHDDRTARMAAARASALCMENASVTSLLSAVSGEDNSLVRGEMYRALGLSGSSEAEAPLIAAVTQEDDVAMPGALEGLMQLIVYAGRDAESVKAFDWQHILKLALHHSDPSVNFRAGYLMTRIRNLEAVIPADRLIEAIAQAGGIPHDGTAETVRLQLVRVATSYGEGLTKTLIRIATGDDKALAFEAIRGLGRRSDIESLSVLTTLLETHPDTQVKRAVLSALTARADSDAILKAYLEKNVNDDTPAVIVARLQALGKIASEDARAQATAMLDDENYYVFFQAVQFLARDEAGKTILKAYLDAHPDTVRAREASIGIDPTIEARTTTRPSSGFAQSHTAVGRRVRLYTTRGEITIRLSPYAPFTANNFLNLAREGKMDGMLWHRVIPNFVAQAGQKEDMSLYEWGQYP